ncbi:MAG: rod shape-determining protein MreC [Nitrospirae bacterium]|nr:rod shape-determining protein MreC [Candidatus Troglogloeales bacterium]
MIRQETLYKRLVISLLSAVVVIFFVAVGIYKKPVQWAESLVGGVIYSVQEGTYTVVFGIQGVFTHYFFLVGLSDENPRLKKEIERLSGEVNRLKEKEALAVRLQGLLNFKDASPLKLIAANVIGREMGPWFQTFMINKGSSEGVLVDMGVIVPDGVVGKVIKSLPHNAQVLLMTDTNSAIAAMVQRTREGGIVQGMGENGARLKYLPRVSEVLEGDIMITSGLEGSFAKGVPIGQIKKIERPEDGFFLNITLTPAIAFSKLEEVLVLSFQENPQ